MNGGTETKVSTIMEGGAPKAVYGDYEWVCDRELTSSGTATVKVEDKILTIEFNGRVKTITLGDDGLPTAIGKYNVIKSSVTNVDSLWKTREWAHIVTSENVRPCEDDETRRRLRVTGNGHNTKFDISKARGTSSPSAWFRPPRTDADGKTYTHIRHSSFPNPFYNRNEVKSQSYYAKTGGNPACGDACGISYFKYGVQCLLDLANACYDEDKLDSSQGHVKNGVATGNCIDDSGATVSVLAFQGTGDAQDFAVDVFGVADNFWTGYTQVEWDNVDKNKVYDVCTGHSLGGALAKYHSRNTQRCKRVVTFGAPKTLSPQSGIPVTQYIHAQSVDDWWCGYSYILDPVTSVGTVGGGHTNIVYVGNEFDADGFSWTCYEGFGDSAYKFPTIHKRETHLAELKTWY